MSSAISLAGEALFPSEWIGAVDLKGQDRVLTIASVEKAEVFNPRNNSKKSVAIITFEKAKKRWIVNKTNAGTIAGLHGFSADQWHGKRIILYPTTCKVGRGTEPCVRVREYLPDQLPSKPMEIDQRPIGDDEAAAIREAEAKQ